MSLKTEFEDRLVELKDRAVDGRGLPVCLPLSGYRASDLRDMLFDLLESVDRETRFINGLATGPGECERAEAAFWDNVALAARATAAALRLEAEKKMSEAKIGMSHEPQMRAYLSNMRRREGALGSRARAFGMATDGDFNTGEVWFTRGTQEWRFSCMSEAEAFLTGLETPRE